MTVEPGPAKWGEGEVSPQDEAVGSETGLLLRKGRDTGVCAQRPQEDTERR